MTIQMSKWHRLTRCIFLVVICLVFQVVNQIQAQPSDVYLKAINHKDRSASDKAKDKTRKPEKILPFVGLEPGGTVLELGAGGGHTTELLARVVGEKGRVYAQGLSQSRVRNGRLANVVALRKHMLFELPDILSEYKVEPQSLDAVVLFFTLHDFYLNNRIDKQGLFALLRNWLKEDGVLVVLDNAAQKNAGVSVNQRLHRIGENFVIDELEKAGFSVAETSDALRNPEDNHTRPWRVFNGIHDRFAIKFIKTAK